MPDQRGIDAAFVYRVEFKVDINCSADMIAFVEHSEGSTPEFVVGKQAEEQIARWIMQQFEHLCGVWDLEFHEWRGHFECENGTALGEFEFSGAVRSELSFSVAETASEFQEIRKVLEENPPFTRAYLVENRLGF